MDNTERFTVLDDTYLPQMAELFKNAFNELDSHVSFNKQLKP